MLQWVVTAGNFASRKPLNIIETCFKIAFLLGSTNFPDILYNILNGLSGIRLPLILVVINREEVAGHHLVTKIRDELTVSE